MNGCRHFVPLLEPFRDGELSPADVVDVEAHLVECERCAERVRLAHAMRASLKAAVRGNAAVTVAFEERIRLALVAERGARRAHQHPRSSGANAQLAQHHADRGRCGCRHGLGGFRQQPHGRTWTERITRVWMCWRRLPA